MPGRRLSRQTDEARIDGIVPAAGLCASCRHLRLARSVRSLFVRCGLADRDPTFARYPRLPVSNCVGWTDDSQALESEAGGPD